MNRLLLKNFKKELLQIKKYMEYLQQINNIDINNIYIGGNTGNEETEKLRSILKIDKEETEKLRSILKIDKTERKIFEYKTILISLYGILEKFIVIWIEDYLNALSKIVPEYDQIDETIREKHFALSLELLSEMTGRKKDKYQHLSKEEVLKNLNDCIEKKDQTSYKINAKAFTLLSGNLKHTKIVELLIPINIKLNEELKKNQRFKKYLQESYEIPDLSRIKTETLYNKINDLVERRNQIAHGSEIDVVLGYTELMTFIPFLENYCQAIFEILEEEIWQHEGNKLVDQFQQIKPEDIFKVYDKRVLTFSIENYEIKKGDAVIVKTSKGRFLKKRILSVQLEEKPHETLKVNEKTNIGIGLDPPITKEQEFFIRRKNKVN